MKAGYLWKLAVAMGLVGMGVAQGQVLSPGAPTQQQQQGVQLRRNGLPQDDGSTISPQTLEKLNNAHNNERQKKLIQDTDALLQLATQLKADVDKTDKDIMSLDVIKRADEIEKLAHAVKERMKGNK